jgi:FixJ family two-component response regulator
MNSWIVVVDDEALSLTNAREILASEGMKVSCLC